VNNDSINKLYCIFGKHVIFAAQMTMALLFISLPVSVLLADMQFWRIYTVATFAVLILVSTVIVFKFIRYKLRSKCIYERDV